MSELQTQVQQAIDELVESGAERGVQVAVYRRGEQVVDAVAGLADPATGRKVESGTPFYNFSLEHPLVHNLTHLHFLVSGCLFWWLVVGRDPSRWRLSYPVKLGIMAIGIPVTQLQQELPGKSLSAVATAHGKNPADVATALKNAARTRIDQQMTEVTPQAPAGA